jgi:hypothetical protein
MNDSDVTQAAAASEAEFLAEVRRRFADRTDETNRALLDRMAKELGLATPAKPKRGKLLVDLGSIKSDVRLAINSIPDVIDIDAIDDSESKTIWSPTWRMPPTNSTPQREGYAMRQPRSKGAVSQQRPAAPHRKRSRWTMRDVFRSIAHAERAATRDLDTPQHVQRDRELYRTSHRNSRTAAARALRPSPRAGCRHVGETGLVRRKIHGLVIPDDAARAHNRSRHLPARTPMSAASAHPMFSEW